MTIESGERPPKHFSLRGEWVRTAFYGMCGRALYTSNPTLRGLLPL